MPHDSENPARRRYICIGYFDKEAMDSQPPEALQRILGQCGPHIERMYASDKVIVDAGLSSQAWWIQRMNGTVRALDGPYAETKECIGSVLLIEADSDEEALSIAQLHPTTQIPEGERLGWRLEVRPVHYLHAPALR